MLKAKKTTKTRAEQARKDQQNKRPRQQSAQIIAKWQKRLPKQVRNENADKDQQELQKETKQDPEQLTTF